MVHDGLEATRFLRHVEKEAKFGPDLVHVGFESATAQRARGAGGYKEVELFAIDSGCGFEQFERGGRPTARAAIEGRGFCDEAEQFARVYRDGAPDGTALVGQCGVAENGIGFTTNWRR